MFCFKVFVNDSEIQGKGVFADEDIPKDSIVWIFKEGYDKRDGKEFVDNLSKEHKEYYEKHCYLSRVSNTWVCPPKDDPSNYVNHNRKSNLIIRFDKKISPEIFFVSNKDIKKGEEITNNYAEFDEFTKNTNPEWL